MFRSALCELASVLSKPPLEFVHRDEFSVSKSVYSSKEQRLRQRPAWESNPAVETCSLLSGFAVRGRPSLLYRPLIPAAETRGAAHSSRASTAHLLRGLTRAATGMRCKCRMLLLQVAFSTGRAEHFRVSAHQLLELRPAVFTAIFVDRHSLPLDFINKRTSHGSSAIMRSCPKQSLAILKSCTARRFWRAFPLCPVPLLYRRWKKQSRASSPVSNVLAPGRMLLINSRRSTTPQSYPTPHALHASGR